MGGHKNTFSRLAMTVALALLLIPLTHGLNLGLIAGDLKRYSSPLVIKKLSKHSPIYININSGLSKFRAPLTLPKLPHLKSLESTKPSRKLPRSILPPLPKLPLLPILPPILPHILPIPKLLFLPILTPFPLFPPLPLFPKLKSPLQPLRVPIIKRSPAKALESKLTILKVPPLIIDNKDSIIKKLLDLMKKGSLTAAEYFKLKKLLLK